MKTLIFPLMLALLVLPLFAGAHGNEPKEAKKSTTVAPTDEEALYFDPEHQLWFQERVYIHIADLDDKPILDGVFSKQDLASNQELQRLLRKSTHYLTVDNHYYFFLEQEVEKK